MMAQMRITREQVLSRLDVLPAFPKTVQRILETVDDPQSNMTLLADMVAHDPAIAARVFAVAHKAANDRHRGVNDIYTATSLIGTQTVREIALSFGVPGFIQNLACNYAKGEMWRHSVAVGVCAQELAWQIDSRDPIPHAFIAGLLHNIGHLWLLRFAGEAYASCWAKMSNEGVDICRAEESIFGVNHAVLGSWLANNWGLPLSICNAIKGHHFPDAISEDQPLVNLLHVAGVLSNALGLNENTNGHVHYLSSKACLALGLEWTCDMRSLFGRIDARTKYMSQLLSN
jgi:HD-like signal output (HDOD) protein